MLFIWIKNIITYYTIEKYVCANRCSKNIYTWLTKYNITSNKKARVGCAVSSSVQLMLCYFTCQTNLTNLYWLTNVGQKQNWSIHFLVKLNLGHFLKIGDTSHPRLIWWFLNWNSFIILYQSEFVWYYEAWL